MKSRFDFPLGSHLPAGRRQRPGCQCRWDKEDPSGLLQSDTRTSASGPAVSYNGGTRAGFGPSFTNEGWVFPLGSMCFIRITAGIPLGFLPALLMDEFGFQWQPPNTAEITGYRQRSVDNQPLPPGETQRTFSIRNKLHAPFQKHKPTAFTRSCLCALQSSVRPMDVMRARTKRRSGEHTGNGHGSFSRLLPPPYLLPAFSKLCFC